MVIPILPIFLANFFISSIKPVSKECIFHHTFKGSSFGLNSFTFTFFPQSKRQTSMVNKWIRCLKLVLSISLLKMLQPVTVVICSSLSSYFILSGIVMLCWLHTALSTNICRIAPNLHVMYFSWHS